MHTLSQNLPFDIDAFDRQLESCNDPLVQFRKTLQETDQIQREQFMAGEKAAVLVPQRALIIDKLLIRAWLKFFQHGAEA